MTELLLHIWLIPFFPLLGFIIIGLGRNFLPSTFIYAVGCISVFLSFLLSLYIFQLLAARPDIELLEFELFSWLNIGTINIPFIFIVDRLTAVMLLIVTGVGFLIHLYSVGYMSHDKGKAKFFAYLNLFVFFMLILVMASNFVTMFIGWEGVGLCSYLLIGFWFKNKNFTGAAKKAFIMNRIGDLGFLIAIFMIIFHFGTAEFLDINLNVAGFDNPYILTIITLLLFFAATGKSAQIPLFTWLPDAMAGPTPVSALIHAATMVTAGVYLIIRNFALFSLTPVTNYVILIIALLTALLAAIIACTQMDIKKILAYSTVSQLGFMFIALGLGAYTTGLFHVITHAFFKALLFLGAGSIIHALSNNQDIRQMGGLKNKIPLTYITFLIGALALSGVPPFAGFFSKDEILLHLFERNTFFWMIGITASLLTAFYSFRMVFAVFFGSFLGNKETESNIHEAPRSMTIPLIFLSLFAVVAGGIGLPESWGMGNFLNAFLEEESNFIGASLVKDIHVAHSLEIWLMIAAAGGALLVILFTYIFYVKKQNIPSETTYSNFIKTLSYNKFFVDECYHYLIVQPYQVLSKFLNSVVEWRIFDGLIRSVGYLGAQSGLIVRRIQTGFINHYIYFIVLGILFTLCYALYFFNTHLL